MTIDIVDCPIKNKVILNSYVKLPESISKTQIRVPEKNLHLKKQKIGLFENRATLKFQRFLIIFPIKIGHLEYTIYTHIHTISRHIDNII